MAPQLACYWKLSAPTAPQKMRERSYGLVSSQRKLCGIRCSPVSDPTAPKKWEVEMLPVPALFVEAYVGGCALKS